MKKRTMIISAILSFALILMLTKAEKSMDERHYKSLEDAVKRAAVACYAAEGFYPDSTAYLKENYGLIADEKRYTIIYDAFASNILPQITVLANE